MAEKINLTLKKKYFAVSIIGLLGIIITFTIINTNYQNINSRDQHLKQAQNLLTILKVSTAEDIYLSRIDQLRKTINFIKKNEAIKEILILDKTNSIIADGNSENSKSVPSLNNILLEKALSSDEIVWEFKEGEIHLITQVELPNIKLGSIKMVYSLKELRTAELESLLNNLKFGLIIFLVAFLFVLFFIKKIVDPIKLLTDGTKQVASGNYNWHLNINTRDELEELADSFNKMVDEVKLSRDEMLSAKDKAEASDRLKTEFLAQMSHEIRTPINAIVNFTELLKTEFEYKLYGEVKESFEIIELSSTRLIRTIDLILSMAELQTGNYKAEFTVTDLYNDIILPLISEFTPAAKNKNLLLTAEATDHNLKVNGDKYSLTQLFANLIDNAIKYTDEGEVKIELGMHKNSDIYVHVIDTGIGIAEDFMPFIYEPFMQEARGYSRKYEGTGLGLALVKKYCEINDAEIKIATNKNEGTTFTIMFFKTVVREDLPSNFN